MLIELLTAYGCYSIVRDVWRFFARRRGLQPQGGRAVQPYHPQDVTPAQRPRRGWREQPADPQDCGQMPMPGGVTDFEITITGRHYDFR